MEYIITLTNGNNRKVLSRHKNLDDALTAGNSTFEKSNRGDVISCISGKIDDNGKIEGQYKLYESWF